MVPAGIRCTIRGTIQACVDAIAALVQSMVDTIAAAVESLFDTITTIIKPVCNDVGFVSHDSAGDQ